MRPSFAFSSTVRPYTKAHRKTAAKIGCLKRKNTKETKWKNKKSFSSTWARQLKSQSYIHYNLLTNSSALKCVYRKSILGSL